VNSGTHWGQSPSDDGIRRRAASNPDNRHFSETAGQSQERPRHTKAPPVGFEPTLPAPEADALSPELWGLRDIKGYQSQAPRGHVALVGAITARERLPSRE
jgi:hypothetical protein